MILGLFRNPKGNKCISNIQFRKSNWRERSFAIVCILTYSILQESKLRMNG